MRTATATKEARRLGTDPGARGEFGIAPNQVRLSDITEYRSAGGKVDICAIEDLFSNRIVGWTIDERMKARLVVTALEMAVARRGDVAGRILHSDRGSQLRARKVHRALARYRMAGSMGNVGTAADRPPSVD